MDELDRERCVGVGLLEQDALPAGEVDTERGGERRAVEQRATLLRQRLVRLKATSRERGSARSSVREPRPHAPLDRAAHEQVCEREVGRRQSPVPEENPLVVALAARLRPDDDLGQLGVERRLAEQPRAYVWTQRAEGIVALALAPVVDHDLVHGVEHVQLEDALRPVRHEQGACIEPRRAQERRRLGEPGRLDDDVGADDCLLDRLDDADGFAERLLEPPPKLARDSGRLLVTRISSKWKKWSSMTTFENAVPRAPMWPSTFEPARASSRAPRAVSAPVLRSVISVASTIARGTPVRGS